MLSRTQIEQYNEIGAIVVPDILSADEVQRLRRVTDEFVERARGVTEQPRSMTSRTATRRTTRGFAASRRRICIIRNTARLVRHPKILAVLQDLWGPDIRFDTAKLNMKCAGFGAPVEWHQDWAFYPHTNDDLAAVGVMFDDMADGERAADDRAGQPSRTDLRPPRRGHVLRRDGSDRWRVRLRVGDTADWQGGLDHACTMCGRCTARRRMSRTTIVGCCCFSSARRMHGRSWASPAGIEKFKELMVCGADIVSRGLSAVPVRLPLPPATLQGSLYENQKAMSSRYFTTSAEARQPEPVK